MSGPFQGEEIQYANQRHVALVAEGFGLRRDQPERAGKTRQIFLRGWEKMERAGRQNRKS